MSKKNKKTATKSTENRPAKRKVITTLAQYEAEAKATGGTTADSVPAATAHKKSAEAKKERKPAGPRKSLTSAAVMVLAAAKEPMNAKAIVEKAVANSWYEPGKGLTPHATLYSAMLREARDDGDKARFRKAQRGLWELTDAGKAQVKAIEEAFAAK